MITFCLIVNKNWLSREISFKNVIPCLFDHDSFIGVCSVNLLFPSIDHTESELGISIFLSEVTNPLSIKYPSSIFLGFNKITFSLLSNSVLYFLNLKTSMIAPFRDIEPIIFLFSKFILSFWFIASSLETLTKFSFWSKLGASESFSILFF